jgi:hypothetical protein
MLDTLRMFDINENPERTEDEIQEMMDLIFKVREIGEYLQCKQNIIN